MHRALPCSCAMLLFSSSSFIQLPIPPFSGPSAFETSFANTANPPRWRIKCVVSPFHRSGAVGEKNNREKFAASGISLDFTVSRRFTPVQNAQRHVLPNREDLLLYQRIRHTFVHSTYSAACACSTSDENCLIPCSIHCDRLRITTVVQPANKKPLTQL